MLMRDMLMRSPVVLPIAETIATTRFPRLCRSARLLATARIFAGVSRQVPPYFCTMMGLLRILLTEIPRASPARQREQTATRAAARHYQEYSPFWVNVTLTARR